MDKYIKVCGNCDYFRYHGGFLHSLCLMNGRAVSKIGTACTKYTAKNAEEEAEHSTNNDRPYKTVKWPFQRVELDRFIFKPIYDEILQEQIGDGQYHQYERRIACQLIDMDDRAVYDAAIRAAYEAGIDIVYLMDKQFVLDALREKLEREGYGRK